MPMPGTYWSGCRCREMTGGICPACASRPVSVRLTLNGSVEPSLRSEMARLLRRFADGETPLVRERLLQVADVFELGGV